MLWQGHLAGRKDPENIAVILFPAQDLQNPAESLEGDRGSVWLHLPTETWEMPSGVRQQLLY